MAKYILLSLFLMVFIAGCGESIFEIGSNKNTNAAKEDTLDFNFIAGNCSPVIAHFDNIDSTGARLSTRETIMYLSALLECGGFNIINGIGAFTENNNGDIYSVTGSMVGLKSVDVNTLNALNQFYIKASKICQTKLSNSMFGDTIDPNITALCGFTGMIGTTLSLTELIAQVSGSNNIEFSEEGYNNVLSGIDVNKNVGVFLGENPAFIDNLTGILDSVSSLPEGVASIVGDTSAVVEEYKQMLYDENTGKVSEDKLKAFLQEMQSGSVE